MTRSTANVVAVRRPRPRITTPLADIEQQALQFIANWRTAKKAGDARDKARDLIKAWFTAGSYGGQDVAINDNGSQILTFDVPKEIDGAKFVGLENRRTVSSELDLDLVDEWLAKLPADKRADYRKRLYKVVRTEEFNSDALFALQQEGAISEAELDGMFESRESWALCVVKD